MEVAADGSGWGARQAGGHRDGGREERDDAGTAGAVRALELGGDGDRDGDSAGAWPRTGDGCVRGK